MRSTAAPTQPHTPAPSAAGPARKFRLDSPPVPPHNPPFFGGFLIRAGSPLGLPTRGAKPRAQAKQTGGERSEPRSIFRPKARKARSLRASAHACPEGAGGQRPTWLPERERGVSGGLVPPMPWTPELAAPGSPAPQPACAPQGVRTLGTSGRTCNGTEVPRIAECERSERRGVAPALRGDRSARRGGADAGARDGRGARGIERNPRGLWVLGRGTGRADLAVNLAATGPRAEGCRWPVGWGGLGDGRCAARPPPPTPHTGPLCGWPGAQV